VGASPLSPTAVALAPGPALAASSQLAFSENAVLEDSVLVLLDTTSATETLSVALDFTASDVHLARDGSVWVLGGNTLLHFDRSGRVLCRLGVNGGFQSLLDSRGDVWVAGGTFQHLELTRVSGSATIAQQGGDPSCGVVDLTPDDPATYALPVTGFVAPFEDENRWVWLPGKKLGRIDLLQPVPRVQPVAATDSALDATGVIGGDGAMYAPKPARRYDVAAISSGKPASYELFDGASNVAALAPSLDDSLWGVNVPFGFDPSTLVQLDPVSRTIVRTVDIPVPAFTFNFNDGIAVDPGGRIWLNEGSALLRLEPRSESWTEVKRRDPPRLYPGSTNRGLLALDRYRGSWSQVLDSGSFDVRWATLGWCASTPGGSRVVATARFADDPADLDTTTSVCGPYDTGPADLASCSGGRRYARLEFLLSGHGSPSVDCIRLTWDRK
jgi:hypothetical protein